MFQTCLFIASATFSILFAVVTFCGCAFRRYDSVFLCVHFLDRFYVLAPIRVHRRTIPFFLRLSTRWCGFTFLVTHVIVADQHGNISYEENTAASPVRFTVGIHNLVPALNPTDFVPMKERKQGNWSWFIMRLCLQHGKNGLKQEYGIEDERVLLLHRVIPPSRYGGLIGFVFVYFVKEGIPKGTLRRTLWCPLRSILEKVSRVEGARPPLSQSTISILKDMNTDGLPKP